MINMVSGKLDTSQLPPDILSYRNESFYYFIEEFCGKEEADLLSIQAIRSINSLIAIQDVYSIFSVDSEDLVQIQTRCGFRNRDGTFTVKPGIKSSIDHVIALLKEMKKQSTRMAKNRSISFQSTPVLPSSGRTETEHIETIKKCIEDWCVQMKQSLNDIHIHLIYGIDYQLEFDLSLDKGIIKCSCGILSSLFFSASGNFKVNDLVRIWYCPLYFVESNNNTSVS